MPSLSVTFQLRRDTAANWTAANPVLEAGEPGVESDTYRWKIGDGATAWNSLNYVTGIAVGTTAPSSPAVNDLWVDTN